MTAVSYHSLVPTRFLILLANFIILILAIWSRDANVTASLPFEFEEEEYLSVDYELTVGLSLGIAFVSIELISFVSGVTMFKPSISLISIFFHGIACFATSQWFINSWNVNFYWFIFTFCLLLPSITEIFMILRMLFASTIDL